MRAGGAGKPAACLPGSLVARSSQATTACGTLQPSYRVVRPNLTRSRRRADTGEWIGAPARLKGYGVPMLALLFSLAFAAPGGFPATEVSTAQVTNPATGAKLAVYVDAPQGKGPWPAIVSVPGGLQSAENTISEGGRRRYANAGVVTVRFDPDGRGRSGGVEDYNGAAQQAGLRAVVAWAAAQPNIIDDKVGVVSYSAGLLLAAPALAGGKHMARFLLDWEGPPDSTWLLECRPGGSGQAFKHSCTDAAFWATRNALTALPKIGVPYWRVQASVDHHGGTNMGHVRAALAAAAGYLPWVRLNNAPATTKGYSDAAIEAALLPKFNGGDRDEALTRYVTEAFKSLGK